MRFPALAMGLVVFLGVACIDAIVPVIGPVLVENRSAQPMVIRAFGHSLQGDNVTLTLSLPAGSKVLVGDDGSGRMSSPAEIDVLTSSCVVRAGFSLDTGREGGQILVGEDGSIKRIGEGTAAPPAEPAAATTLCSDPDATPLEMKP